MSELIPTYSITDFKKLKVSQIKQLKSCNIVSDGEYVFPFVNPNTLYIRTQVEGLALLSNTVGGKLLEDIIGQEKGEA